MTFSIIAFIVQRPSQAIQKFFPGDLPGAKPFEVFGCRLAVYEFEAQAGQQLHQEYQCDL
jgi:hypothetical protein